MATPGKRSEQPIESDDRRITTLTDSAFAIVMTLLVVGINIPAIADERLEEELTREVFRLWPRILAYVVSFLNLGIFWMGHHTQFHFMRRVNRVMLWLNILFLMAVSLVPFTTHLVGLYGDQEIALSLYGLNFIAISLLLLLNWRYAARKGFLKDAATGEVVIEATRHILIGPAIYAVGIVLSFFEPRLSLALFMLVPILHLLPGPIHLHWTR